jgi:DnaK suppressor protein
LQRAALAAFYKKMLIPPCKGNSGFGAFMKEKKKKQYLTPGEIEKFRALLWEKRNEVLGNVSYMEKDALREGRSDLSNVPIHMADLGTDSYEQEFTLDLMDSERKLINEIDNALARIDKGTYGICELDGKPIPKQRLEAIPWALYCISCANSSEKKLFKKNENHNRYGFAGSMDEDDDSDADDVKKVS